MLHLLLPSGGGARPRRCRRVDRRAPAEDQQVGPVPPSCPAPGRPHPAASLPLALHEPLPDHYRGRERCSPASAPAHGGARGTATSSAPAARTGTGRIRHTAYRERSGWGGDDLAVSGGPGLDGLLDQPGEAVADEV